MRTCLSFHINECMDQQTALIHECSLLYAHEQYMYKRMLLLNVGLAISQQYLSRRTGGRQHQGCVHVADSRVDNMAWVLMQQENSCVQCIGCIRPGNYTAVLAQDISVPQHHVQTMLMRMRHAGALAKVAAS